MSGFICPYYTKYNNEKTPTKCQFPHYTLCPIYRNIINIKKKNIIKARTSYILLQVKNKKEMWILNHL